jgi:transketolase
MFRPIPGCVVLYPSDAVSSDACVAAAAAHKGMCYIRTSRPATPLLYPAGEAFPVGGSKVLRKGEKDAVTVVAAGITVHEALKACDVLKKEGLGLRVVDAYSVAPLDGAGILREVAETGGRAVVVEDHYAAGGLGEAVAEALAGKAALTHLCIRELPRSGKPDELLERFGISAAHIVQAVRELAGR